MRRSREVCLSQYKLLWMHPPDSRPPTPISQKPIGMQCSSDSTRLRYNQPLASSWESTVFVQFYTPSMLFDLPARSGPSDTGEGMPGSGCRLSVAAMSKWRVNGTFRSSSSISRLLCSLDWNMMTLCTASAQIKTMKRTRYWTAKRKNCKVRSEI